MPYSYKDYTGDGATREFTITFPYLSAEHIKVYVEDSIVEWDLIDTYTVRTAVAPDVGDTVRIRRETEIDERIVDFNDTSDLTEANLDTSALQWFYLLQEHSDKIGVLQIDQVWGGSFPSLTSDDITQGNVNLYFQSDWTLDDIVDGVFYGRAAAGALDASGFVLLSAALGSTDDITEGETHKWFSAKTLDDLPDGTSYRRVQAAALDETGLYFLAAAADVVDNTYGLLNASHLDATGLIFMSAIYEIDAGTYQLMRSAALDASGLLLQAYISEVDAGTHALFNTAYLTASGLLLESAIAEVDAGTRELVNSANLTASGLWLTSKLDQVDAGTHELIQSANLSASGLVLTSALSEVYNGTEALLDATYVTSGKIKVSAGSPFDTTIPVGMTDADLTSTTISGGLVTTGYIVASDGSYMFSVGCALNASYFTTHYPVAANFDADGQCHQYYWDTSTWVEVANMGIEQESSDYICLLGGTYDTGGAGDRIGVFGRSNTHHAVAGTTQNDDDGAAIAGGSFINNNSGSYGRGVTGLHNGSGTGARGACTTGTGVHGYGRVAVKAENLSASNGGNVELTPITGTAPTHVAAVGTLFCLTTGVLYINTDGSTTWATL